MKKLILPIFFSIFFLLITSSNTSAQSSDCWKEYSDIKPICDQAITEQNLLEKCDQANNTFHQCLGVDKNPWKLQSNKPGHLSCKEWKNLSIVGTAQNCVAPVTELFERKLWCLSSIAEISQVRSHPVDYILDFDPNSCITTEDDLRQFKAGLPPASGSFPEVSLEKTNNSTGQKTPSVFNIFGINPYQTWLNLIELAKARAFMGTGALDRFAESTILHGVGVEPFWERDARETKEINKFYDQTTERFLKLKGKTRWTDINDDTKRVLIEAVKDSVTLKKDSAVIDLQPYAGEKGVLETDNKPLLKSGAVDVIVQPQDGKQFEMQTPNAEILVIGTEFSVIYDQKESKTLVVVYKGKVEVKTKDGQSVTVVPDGDLPGKVIVSQKLSPIKLAIVSGVLVVIFGGAIMILRKKFTPKGFSKKKK